VGFILPVLREDPSRAAHPGPTGQGRAQREAGGRPLAAAVGDAAAVSWLLSSFHPPFADPSPASWFPAVATRAAWADGGPGVLPKRPQPCGCLPGRLSSSVWKGWEGEVRPMIFQRQLRAHSGRSVGRHRFPEPDIPTATPTGRGGRKAGGGPECHPSDGSAGAESRILSVFHGKDDRIFLTD